MPEPATSSADRGAGEAGSEPVLVRADGLAIGYGGHAVLTDVSFALRAGQRVGVLGPNGGGKTTLFRAVLGEIEPLAGRVEAPQRCGVVPQTERSRLDFPVSALDVALMGAVSGSPWWRRLGRAERSRARDALAAVGLADRADTTFGDLSGGQRQRVLVARALVQDAQVILLDEPFSGLDATSTERLEGLLAQLAAQGRALLVASHDVEQVQGWDRVLCLNGRQIAYGPPQEVLTRDVLEATYGGTIVELPCGGGRGVLPAHHHHHHDH
jgi:ABC-type Mn2+/Zn2+ transport system ATPase subunit